MAHAYLINIRETDGKTDIYVLPVFNDRIYLVSDIALRFFY